MTTILETDETGALLLPADVLGHGVSRARYVVEAQGETLIVRPEGEMAAESTAPRGKTRSHEEWMKDWTDLAEQISQSWIGDKSALEELEDMRNARG